MTHSIKARSQSGSQACTTCGFVAFKTIAVHAGTTLAIGLSTLLLGACASAPPPPDWQASAHSALGSYTSAYLAGNTRVAEHEFNRAKAEVARTGRPDLMARLELTRCATQVASLDFSPCTAYQTLAMDAKPPERAYAAFLSGDWTTLDPAQLPAPYQTLVTQAQRQSATVQTNSPLGQIQDPLSRLVAAGMLYKKELITPDGIALAVEMASNQGWRRPLLTWLGVQIKHSQAAGDTATAASLQRRLDMVLQTPAR
jgi:hypothetical protein